MTPEWIQAIGTILAIFAASIAIFVQSRQLRSQRVELELQREQLELQRIELSKNTAIQERIAETASLNGYLDLQVRLIGLAFEYDELPQTFNLSGAPEDRNQWMPHLYFTAWMRLMQSGMALGLITEQTIEAEISTSLFESEIGIRWWRMVGHVWRTEAENLPLKDAERRAAFVEIVERVCRDAEANLRFSSETGGTA